MTLETKNGRTNFDLPMKRGSVKGSGTSRSKIGSILVGLNRVGGHNYCGFVCVFVVDERQKNVHLHPGWKCRSRSRGDMGTTKKTYQDKNIYGIKISRKGHIARGKGVGGRQWRGFA
jgi:hypothetical protein